MKEKKSLMPNRNHLDEQYLNILKDIKENGCFKNTRSGEVLSVFGRSMRLNLSDGFPILTTKKMFTRGFTHELLWFLKGDTNIKYLIDNDVNFWTPDAYRFYNELVKKNNEIRELDSDTSLDLSLDEFINCVKERKTIRFAVGKNVNKNIVSKYYTYGDLGEVYGHQWRHWGETDFDQVRMVVKLLKSDPYSRRVLITGYNPEVVKDIALPPCHVLYQFNARPLSHTERVDWTLNNLEIAREWLDPREETMDDLKVPKFSLSLWFSCRSQDMPLGNPANIMSAALLLSMVAQCVNMSTEDLIWNGGDCHIYLNQMEGVDEQLKRDPHKYNLPKLMLNEEVRDISDFQFDDIKFIDYESYPAIKMPLSVG